MLAKGILTVAVVLMAFSLAGAEMYQWVDDKGVVTFKDSPPPVSKKKNKVRKYGDGDFDPAPAVQAAPAPKTASGAAKTAEQTTEKSSAGKKRFNGTVELYVTDWCGYCKKAIAYLKSKNIRYVAYDIEKDSAAQKRHQELGGRGVPLIVIGSNKMSGFSQEGLEYYLENSK